MLPNAETAHHRMRGPSQNDRRPITPPPSSPSTPSSFESRNGTFVEPSADDDVSAAISWPIVLAVVPTFGAFFAGSADIWSDFVMSLLILYYVYKWITVPWSHYDEARKRRIIHENVRSRQTGTWNAERHAAVAEELCRDERVGLIWLLISPCIAAYTLRFSRYFLTNYDRYTSYFNVTVFVLASLVQPISHAVTLLVERAQSLQEELGPQESVLERVQTKALDMQREIAALYEGLATKKEIGQVANSYKPSLEQLSRALKRLEERERLLQRWSDGRFDELDAQVREFDQFILYNIEKDQRRSSQRTVVTLMFLPIRIMVWMAQQFPVLRLLTRTKPAHT